MNRKGKNRYSKRGALLTWVSIPPAVAKRGCRSNGGRGAMLASSRNLAGGAKRPGGCKHPPLQRSCVTWGAWLVQPNQPYTILPRIPQKARGSFWANCQKLVKGGRAAVFGGCEPVHYTKSGGFRQEPWGQSWRTPQGNRQNDRFSTKNSCNILCNPTLRKAFLFGKITTSKHLL